VDDHRVPVAEQCLRGRSPESVCGTGDQDMRHHILSM
jgi:hypothetical protein